MVVFFVGFIVVLGIVSLSIILPMGILVGFLWWVAREMRVKVKEAERDASSSKTEVGEPDQSTPADLP
jgi:hypothetical protein